MSSIYNFFGKNLIIDKNLAEIENFKESIKDLGFDFTYNPVFLNQIHSNKVLVIDDIRKDYSLNPLFKADAIVTNIANLPISIITADCVPILFYDDVAGVVAVCHAGWRGAFAEIVENTICKMQNLKSKTKNIKSIIGPAIRQESYEVTDDFFLNFIKKDLENKIFFRRAKNQYKYLFNLTEFCISKIKKMGVFDIKDTRINTYKEEKSFFSYRRSFHQKQSDCGRNVSVIMKRPLQDLCAADPNK